MGFLDLFKRNKNNIKVNENTKLNEEYNNQRQDIQIIMPVDGGKKIEIEYYDPDIKYGQFYDTTRIIIDKAGKTLGTSTVRECLISWYNEDDTIYSDYNSREDYEKILVSLDVDKMVSDERYCSFAMRQLLNRKRVVEYLQRGKSSEKQEIPCGNYVGGVKEDTEGNLKKVFDVNAGKESHFSKYMTQVREAEKRKIEEAKLRKRSELEKKIKEAQDELDRL